MASLLVLVAHSGRTLQLDVQPSTRVDAVQHALVSFTGIPVADQIAMYQGARLDPAKLLGAYRLPVDPAVAALEDHPVFLYCRSYLKPGAALPPPEELTPLQVQVPPLAEVNLAHPLHSAPSPLVRALPDYERHFQHHLATTRAYWDVAQARLQRCRQLLSEQEVQARAADAARANVEAHYNYILNSYQTFLEKYNAQHAAHAALLTTFPSDLAALESIELHPSLQQQQQQEQQLQSLSKEDLEPSQPRPLSLHTGSGGCALSSPTPAPTLGPRHLADLYPVQRLREWAETCSRSHGSFSAKVSELEALFQLLRKDVEGLFMQAPSVDLDALGRQMAEHEALLDEHSSMVQVLSKDLRTVRTLVEDVVRQLGSAAGGPGGGTGGLRQGALHDAAAAMEAIHETHRNRVLPRLAQLDSQLAAFAARVEASKVAMSRDVLSQLQRISGQQSRIRDMKNKLAAFHEVLGRQDAAFAELRVVHRLPSAYRALLAEVVRRNAWHQLYCGQAGRLAEHMARFRDKEAGRRTVFASQVARYIPSDLLARAGLASEPPRCQVTVPPPDVPLISVAMADLQRLAYLDERILAACNSLRASAAPPSHSAGSSLHHQHHQHHRANPVDSMAAGSHPHQHQHQHHQHHQHHHSQAGSRIGGASSIPFPGTVAVLDADPPPPTDSVNALEMENARLRAELANHIAAACIRELNTVTSSSGDGEAQQPVAAVDCPAVQQVGPVPPPPPSSSAGAPSVTPRHGRVSSGGASGGASLSGVSAPAPGGSPSAPPRRDPAEVLAAMQRALGMKDDLIKHQQREMAALAARAAAYEDRITSLEALLTQQARASCGDRLPVSDAERAILEERSLDGPSNGASDPAVSSASPVAQPEVEEGVMGRSIQDEVVQHQPVETEAIASSAAEGPGAVVDADEAFGSRRLGGTGTGALGEAAIGIAEEPGGETFELVAAATSSLKPVDEQLSGPAPVDGTGFRAMAGIGLADGDKEMSSRDVSRDRSSLGTLPALSVNVELATAAQPSTSALSPFSLQAAQQQEVSSSGALQREGLGDVVGAAVVACRRTSKDDDESTCATVAAPTRHGSRSGSGGQPRRGSSGPQAIPQVSGGLRWNGAAGAPIDDKSGLPYEPRVPMSIGSLPFATSLPVGSVLTGRLASSPSAGIGLGLALGFGLTTLAEGGRRPSAIPGDGEGGRSGERSSRSSGSGNAGTSSGGCSSRRASVDGEEAGAKAGGGVQTSDSREPLQGSSSSASSGGLQFQPSWSAPVSGDWAIGAAAGGDGPITAGTVDESGAGTTGGAGEEMEHSDIPPTEVEEAAEGRSRTLGADTAGGAECDSQASTSVSLDGTVGQLGRAGAAVACVTMVIGKASVAEGVGPEGTSNEGAVVEDVPDIDEIFDSDGAWEVTSAAAGAAAAVGDLATDNGGAVELAAEFSNDLGEVGDDDDGVVGDEHVGDVPFSQVMEASSGYESVGSDVDG